MVEYRRLVLAWAAGRHSCFLVLETVWDKDQNRSCCSGCQLASGWMCSLATRHLLSRSSLEERVKNVRAMISSRLMASCADFLIGSSPLLIVVC